MTQSTHSHLLRVVIVLVLVLMISLLTVQLSPSAAIEQVRAAPDDSLSQQSTAGRLDALEAEIGLLTERVAQLEAAAGIDAPVASTTSQATLAASATVAAARPSVASNANVRSGPGTGYAIVRTLRAGETLTLVARNGNAGDVWYQLADGAWIYGTLVQDAPSGLPFAAAPASAPAPTVGAASGAALPVNSLASS